MITHTHAEWIGLQTIEITKIDDYMYIASKILYNYVVANVMYSIVFGNNKEWKQKLSMSKQVNQSFLRISHIQFI